MGSFSSVLPPAPFTSRWPTLSSRISSCFFPFSCFYLSSASKTEEEFRWYIAWKRDELLEIRLAENNRKKISSMIKRGFQSTRHAPRRWCLVKSSKRVLVAILSNQTLTDEVLVTALVTVDNLLNGQPLTYISNDANTSEVQNPLIKRRANPNMLPDTFDGCDMSDIQKALVFLLSTRDSVLETLDD